MGDKLTFAEQDALEKMKKVCTKHGPKSAQTQFNCAVLKKQLIEENERKEKELLDAARHNLNNERLKAVAFVTRKMNIIQNNGMLLHGALLQASTNYDQILGAKAAKPVFGEIVQGLMLTLLPELKLLGRSVNFFAPSMKIVHVSSDLSKHKGLRPLLAELEKVAQKREKQLAEKIANFNNQAFVVFASALDNQSKDLIEAIKDPFSSNADVDEETKKRFAAHSAKNQILGQVLKQVQMTLAKATLLETIYHKFIFWYEGQDVVAVLEKNFSESGLEENISYNVSDYELLADLVLYDMLRAYVNSYFEVLSNAASVDNLPSKYDEDYVKGLDLAQRKLIYAKFSKVSWKDPTRPPVKDYKDLIKHWKNGNLTPYEEIDYGGAAAWF